MASQDLRKTKWNVSHATTTQKNETWAKTKPKKMEKKPKFLNHKPEKL